MAAARNWIEAKDTKMASGKMSNTHHSISVSPEGDQRAEKLGKMVAAIAAGTNTAKCEFHGSNTLLKRGSLNYHMTNVTIDFVSVTS